jgi:hypothetical protein
MNGWQIALSILAALVALPYLIGPLIVYRKVWFSLKPEIKNLSEHELPDEVRGFFNSASKQFSKVGFVQHAGDFFISEMFAGVQEHFVRAFINPQTRESGGAVIIRNQLPHQKDLVVRSYGFSSEGSDHREVSTINSTQPSLPISSNEYREIVLPEIWDIEKLYCIHRYSTRQILADQPLWLPENDDLIEALLHTLHKPARAMEKMGLLRSDESGQRFVPTLEGAFLLTWQELWPMKWFRLQKLRRLAKTLLEVCH